MVIFPITRSGSIQKSQKKKINFFLNDVFPCGFSISSGKKGGKSKWFCFFSIRVEGKYKKNYKKRKKDFFPPFGRFFDHFMVATLPEKMIRKCLGGKEKE